MGAQGLREVIVSRTRSLSTAFSVLLDKPYFGGGPLRVNYSQGYQNGSFLQPFTHFRGESDFLEFQTIDTLATNSYQEVLNGSYAIFDRLLEAVPNRISNRIDKVFFDGLLNCSREEGLGYEGVL